MLTYIPDSHHKSHTHLGIVDPWIDVFTNIETTRKLTNFKTKKFKQTKFKNHFEPFILTMYILDYNHGGMRSGSSIRIQFRFGLYSTIFNFTDLFFHSLKTL